MFRTFLRATAVVALAGLAACATEPSRPSTFRPPAEVQAQLVALIPASVDDRAGWAADIDRSFRVLDLLASTENLCAVLAVVAQESTWHATPEVPDLARIARAEIDRRAAHYRIPKAAVRAALKLESPDGRSYAERLSRVRTEHELSGIFEDLIGEVPLGRRLFRGANPVRTGGPMQVSIGFAERHERRYGRPFPFEGSVRDAVFTRAGGLHYGIAHLLDYPNGYDRHLYRFADFNAGWYASRNAAFQAAVTAATGIPLALDGDLVLHDAKRGRVGETEAAVRTLGDELGLDARAIRRALERSATHEFETTALYRGVFALAERRAGRTLPRARLPEIALESPKITRKLTTAWFANRVQQRYQRCVNDAFARIG